MFSVARRSAGVGTERFGSAQVESAVKELGLQGREDGEAVRAVFIH